MAIATPPMVQSANGRATDVLESALIRGPDRARERATLGNSMVALEFNKREIIFAMGDASDGVFVVERGRVKAYRLSEDGREITLGILHPGDILGEESLLTAEPRETFAEALEPTTVFYIDAQELRMLATKSPMVAMRLFEIAGSRLARSQKQIEDLAFRGVASRIAGLLVSMAREDGTQDAEGLVLNPRLTHQQMASLVGTTRETFTATLSKLSQQQLIRSSRRSVRVLDLEGLEALV